MKIKTAQQLNKKQREAVEALLRACRGAEPIGIEPDLALTPAFEDAPDAYYLLSDRDMLLSVLILDMASPEEGEIMGFTHPAARGRGYFTALWETLLTQLDERGLLEEPELLFVTDGKSPDAHAALAAMEAELDYTEFFLEKKVGAAEAAGAAEASAPGKEGTDGMTAGRAASAPGKDGAAGRLERRGAESEAELTALHEEIFGDGASASRAFVREMLCDPAAKTFVYYPAGAPADGGPEGPEKPAGLFHLTGQPGACYLSGFGIRPGQAGRGLGRDMLRLAEREAARHADVLFLQVGDYNEPACALYRGAGFTERARREYYV